MSPPMLFAQAEDGSAIVLGILGGIVVFCCVLLDISRHGKQISASIPTAFWTLAFLCFFGGLFITGDITAAAFGGAIVAGLLTAVFVILAWIWMAIFAPIRAWRRRAKDRSRQRREQRAAERRVRREQAAARKERETLARTEAQRAEAERSAREADLARQEAEARRTQNEFATPRGGDPPPAAP